MGNYVLIHRLYMCYNEEVEKPLELKTSYSLNMYILLMNYLQYVFIYLLICLF